jgi:hypothetical protein
MGYVQVIALMTFLLFIDSGSLDATCSTKNKEDYTVNSNNIFPPNIRGSNINKTLTVKFKILENTRYIESYTYLSEILLDDCLNECYNDQKCNAVSFLFADRKPNFFGFMDGICVSCIQVKPHLLLKKDSNILHHIVVLNF